VRTILPCWLPVGVAAANVAAVSLGFVRQEPYPYRLFIPEAVILIGALLSAADSGVWQTIGLLLSLVGMVGSFSAMFFFLPTVVAVLYRLTQPRR
jgi:hypothetical protein